MKRTHKAVSPVVATLLLILIAIAAAVVLYAWVSNLSTSTKATGAERTGVAFSIEAAKLYENTTDKSLARGYDGDKINGSAVDVYVRNIGSVSIENGTWSLYILNPEDNTVVASNTSWSFGQSLAPGSVINMTVILSKNSTVVSGGEFYIVKVVSPQGATDSIYVKAED